MRLNSLLGLGGSKAAEPANKRQKRSDVLDSLGLGQKSEKSKAPLGLPGLTGLAGLTGLTKKSSPQPTVPAVPATAVEAPPVVEAPVEAAEPLDGPANGNGDVQKAQAQAWQNAFAQAQNQWSVSENRERCFYHDTEKDLFFEWDQTEGVLFQYFVEKDEDEKDEKGSPERAPIWSTACPETHAEVWQVLPMPPTDPGAELLRQEADAAVAEVVAEAQADAKAANSEEVKAEMLPPPPKKKKLPPVPIMARSEDDEDERDLKLPETRNLPTVVMGCEGPPAPSSSSSSSVAVEEEEEDPGGRSLVLEEGEEVDDLAAEECALPQAPAPVDFTATDVDLDMFG